MIRSARVTLLFLLLVLPLHLFSQKWKLPPLEVFITDTLHLQIIKDSTAKFSESTLDVIDSRMPGDQILGIRQTMKYKYIPVDQILFMERSMSDLFQYQFSTDSIDLKGSLSISHLILWHDSQAFFRKGLCMNAYTTYHDTSGRPVSDWIWEVRLKRKKKEKDEDFLGRVVQELLTAQSQALLTQNFNNEFYPYLYRRQLKTWSEVIILPDGYAINAHLTLDFPPDQMEKWVRGSPGIFYRRSDVHESIAIGGFDQRWYKRINSSFVTSSSATFRIGFNNFERGGFDHLAYENLLYLNLSTHLSFDYRPIHYRGLYGGFGIYGGYNILPTVIPGFEAGLSAKLGVLLP